MNLDSPRRRRPQPKRLKERLKEATSAAILEAAEAVLLEQGLQASMEAIAARAGVAVGTLYNHFSDRRALVDALLASYREKLFHDVSAAEALVRDRPVREQLLAMLMPLQGTWSRIYLVIKQVEQMPDARRRAEMRDRFRKLFAGVLERGRKQGVLAPDPHQLQPLALQGLLQAFFSYAVEAPQEFAAEDAINQVVDSFLHGAAKRGKP
jgi:AcrR family transcriptional regulator